MSEKRYDHYKVPEIESFMLNILEKKDRIVPIFDLKIGYRYPDVEEMVGMDAGKTISFLAQLFDMGILGRETYDVEVRCPTCDSPNVSTNYICPYCSSSLIRRALLVEHYSCGYVGPVTSLGEQLVCPKCEVRMEEGDYRDAGSIYECASCKKQIETPFVSHWCRECGLKFSFENAVYPPKYAYFPAELTRKEMASGILYLSQVVDVFAEHGFTRVVDSKILGESGVEHIFDAAFEGLGAKFYVDVVFSLDRMSELDFLKESTKIIDVKVDVYLIVLPGLDAKALELAKAYSPRLNIIEDEKPGAALSKLRTALAEKVSVLKTEMTAVEALKNSEASKEPESTWKSLFGVFHRK